MQFCLHCTVYTGCTLYIVQLLLLNKCYICGDSSCLSPKSSNLQRKNLTFSSLCGFHFFKVVKASSCLLDVPGCGQQRVVWRGVCQQQEEWSCVWAGEMVAHHRRRLAVEQLRHVRGVVPVRRPVPPQVIPTLATLLRPRVQTPARKGVCIFIRAGNEGPRSFHNHACENFA